MVDEAAHLWAVAKFIPVTMRTYWRQRNDLVRAGARHIQRIQKALTQMNLQLANVLSDVNGMTGQAILAGERAPHKLAAFRDPRVKASENQIAQSLEGHWQEDLLFVLKQEQEGYEFCQQQMASCDQRLEQYLQRREDRSQGSSLPEEKRKERLKKKKGNKPQFGGPHTDRLYRCHHSDDDFERGRIRYEQMGDRTPYLVRPLGIGWIEERYLAPCAAAFRDFVNSRLPGNSR